MSAIKILLFSLTLLLLVGCRDSGSGLTVEQVDTLLDNQSSLQQEREVISQERAALNEARDRLEDDRRQWDQRQRRDPVIAAAIRSTGLLLMCGLPLIVVALLLWPRPAEPEEHELCDALIADATSQQPQLLIGDQSPRRLK